MQVSFVPAIDFSQAKLVAKPVFKDELPSDLPEMVLSGAAAARFTGKVGQVFEYFGEMDGVVVRFALTGSGDASSDTRASSLEKAGAALAAKYMASGETSIALDVSDTGLTGDEVASLLLGLRLRAWRYDVHRTTLKEEQKITLASVNVAGAPDEAEAVWAVEAALAEGIEFTRELVSEPANVVFPVSFVERCEARLADTGAKIRTLDDAEMEALGMGALLGVGIGSERESRLLVIEWNGGADGEKPTAFVGKGVTFDTGGISLKPPGGMEDMKWDMGGAGAVAGAMLALAKRGAKANIVGICGLVENMPDGRAQRPGDVVKSMSGQTIEVINTDAEGRLVLCDALTWVQREFAPAQIVDFATLTGAMIISLGHEHGGVFSNNDDLADKLLSAGQDTGDKLWRFPLAAEYDKLINSPIADMKNVGPRGAGSITAAQFLQRFVEDDTPWAHCDIAGMVWADKPGLTWGKGATGYGVRIMDQFVRDNLEG